MFWQVIRRMILDDCKEPLGGVYRAGKYCIVSDGMHALFVPQQLTNWKGLEVALGKRLLYSYGILNHPYEMVLSKQAMLRLKLPAVLPLCPICHGFIGKPPCEACDGLGFSYSPEMLIQYPRTDGAQLLGRSDILLSYRSLWILQTLVHRLDSCGVFKAHHPDTYVFHWEGDIRLAIRGIKVTLFYPNQEVYYDFKG